MEKQYKTLWDLIRENKIWYILDNNYNKNSEDMDYELYEAMGELYAESDGVEVYQYFHIDRDSFNILRDYGELVWYNEELEKYMWGVTHYGTGWRGIYDTVFPKQNKDRYELTR